MSEPRPILQLGSATLRQTAQAITDIHSLQTQQLIETLHASLATTQGVGIAAPQIGESWQMMIVASRPNARYPNAPLMSPTVMINPRFQPLSDVKEKDWEGCLSVPSIRALVPRYRDIAVQYCDAHGETIQTQFSGFVARVFQHEFDHLIGKVFLDSIETTLDIIAESEYFARLQAQAR